MLPSVPVQRKYLLLFNRQSRTMLKSELVPTPSKLSEEDVMMYFKKHMMAKGDYYVPKAAVVLKADEEKYMMLAAMKEPKPRAPRAPTKAKMTMEPSMAPMKSVIPPPPPVGSEKAMALEKQRAEIKKLVDMANEHGKLYLLTIIKKPMTAALRKVAKEQMMKHEEVRMELQKLGYAIAALEKPKKK
jgi:hypothetical protein